MTVADQLSELQKFGPEYPLPDAEQVAALRDRVDDAVRRASDEWGMPADRAVIRLPKGRLTIADRCGRQLAKATSDISPTLALLGNAIDTEAALLVLRGKQAGDAWRNATDIWTANDDTEKLAQLAGLDDTERDELGDLIRERTVGLDAAFGAIEPGWWPRAQNRVSIGVGDGQIVLSGIFDLFLGGGRSARPGVIIEVKAGKRWSGNDDDGRLYALLATLRDGVAPASVITVTAADAMAFPEPVRLSVLENAVERIERVLDRVFEVASGSVPEPTVGPWCERCPISDDCPAQQKTATP